MRGKFEYTIYVMYRVRVANLDLKCILDKFDDAVDPDPYNNGRDFVITLDMTPTKNYLWLKELMDDEVIDRTKSDIFISIRSDFDTGIIDFPDWIRAAMSLLDVKIVLSYTIT